MLQIKACGVVVFRDNPIRSFLLMKHPLRWDLPKGHMEEGESELQCALRELQEETNIQPDNISLDRNFRFETKYPVRYKNKHGGVWCEKSLVIFLGRLQHPTTIQVSEHETYQWIHWNPPHRIQQETIDPLLEKITQYLVATPDHSPGHKD